MKIGIDISSMHSMNKGRGIGSYAENLISSLKKYTEAGVVVIDSPKKNEKVDLIHYPFLDFFRPTLKITKNTPTVVTIHDVIPLLFPKHYPPGIKGRINLFRQKQSLKKIKAVIAVSNSAKADIHKIFSLPKNRLKTVYESPANHFQKLSKSEAEEKVRKFNLPEKFVLYTGGVNWNKNLLTQTKAALLTNHDVVFVGGGFENRKDLNHTEMKEFEEFLSRYENNPKIHILGFVSNDELVGLINKAQVILFASRYEGFGLPILEAQICGTPVVAGNNSSMIEVAGDGAELVDANSFESIQSGLNKILNNTVYSRKLIAEGFINVKRFSWEKTAIETLAVYEKALE